MHGKESSSSRDRFVSWVQLSIPDLKRMNPWKVKSTVLGKYFLTGGSSIDCLSVTPVSTSHEPSTPKKKLDIKEESTITLRLQAAVSHGHLFGSRWIGGARTICWLPWLVQRFLRRSQRSHLWICTSLFLFLMDGSSKEKL